MDSLIQIGTSFETLIARLRELPTDIARSVERRKEGNMSDLRQLVCQIDRAIHNPIWRQVREPSPWEYRPAAEHELPSTHEIEIVHAFKKVSAQQPTASANVEESR
ncbi:hypothetical protein [Sinorhizobium terangae]|uniref:hypothetical protein n=1 Tax=Sinorhizobium terangae TaxID=110322 RepID=UPI0024B13537|nr:hypothetical protein [Sinorhizobium terangae]WFU51699.1 hypothetical protein QA637_29970 [Sinorhizobium terangae]